MNTKITQHQPFVDDRVSQWRQKLIDGGARPEPTTLTRVERTWPYLFGLAVCFVDLWVIYSFGWIR